MIVWRNLIATHGHNGVNHQFQLRLRDQSIQPGERIAIIGPSGSGKTTLLSLLSGILLPESGQISIQGTMLSDLSDTQRRQWRRNRIGLMSQRLSLVPHLHVRDNIALPLIANGKKPTKEEGKRITSLMAQVGIASLGKRYPHELSQGESQRVALCRALVHQPDLVLADEPTGNLDAESAQQSVDTLLSYCADNSKTVLMVTHDQTLLSQFDRVLNLSQEALT